MGPIFAGEAAALALGRAAASTIEISGRVLGPSSGGAAAASMVGGAVVSMVENGRVTGRLRGRELEALYGESGVGPERVPLAPGSVVLGNRGNHGERARKCSLGSARVVGTGLSVARGDTGSPSESLRHSGSDSGCGHGATDGERAHAWLDSAVEAWCTAQDSVARSVSSTGSTAFDEVASARPSRLRACDGSVKLFTSSVRSARLAPHIHHQMVRHWFRNAKKFPGVELLRVFVPGSPVCIAGGGNLTAELADGNHPSVAARAVAVHQNLCADVVHGRGLVFDSNSASGIRSLRVPPLAVVLKPKFRISHDFTFAPAGGHISINEENEFSSPLPASSVMFSGMCCYRCCLCGRCTVPQLESSFTALT